MRFATIPTKLLQRHASILTFASHAYFGDGFCDLLESVISIRPYSACHFVYSFPDISPLPGSGTGVRVSYNGVCIFLSVGRSVRRTINCTRGHGKGVIRLGWHGGWITNARNGAHGIYAWHELFTGFLFLFLDPTNYNPSIPYKYPFSPTCSPFRQVSGPTIYAQYETTVMAAVEPVSCLLSFIPSSSQAQA